MGKLIAVYGQAGAGKTTFAYSLADRLATGTALVLLVHTDFALPIVNIFAPQTSTEASLGRLLMTGDYAHIEKTYISYPKNRNLFLSGIVGNENYESYPEISPREAKKYYDTVIEMFDFVIVDCTNNLHDTLALAAIGRADKVINLLTPDAKGIVFKTSYDKLIDKICKGKTLYAAALAKDYSNVKQVEQLLGLNFAAKIPYSTEADFKAMCGEPVKGCSSREGAKYENAVRDICRMVA